ncbi:XRE family transcriptional regulator [Streptomyces sp. NPDC004542]|uniref:XRE family transcriptional regulator n=1 Tax=Streptomyces sp. NPDC004542 TaxID=3154281 RepID=UPI0033BC17A3
MDQHPVQSPSQEQHPVEAVIRASVAAVRNVTGESLTDIAKALGRSKVLISGRQRGQFPWKTSDIGWLADHWKIPPHTLLAGPTAAISALSVARVDELRSAKGLPKQATLPVLATTAA